MIDSDHFFYKYVAVLEVYQDGSVIPSMPAMQQFDDFYDDAMNRWLWETSPHKHHWVGNIHIKIEHWIYESPKELWEPIATPTEGR